MSIITALKINNKTILCADTQLTCGEEKYNRTSKNNLKFTIFKNNLIIGHVGAVKVSQYICANENWFKIENTLTKKYIVKNIVPKLIKGLDEQKLLTTNKNGFIKMECSLLLAYKDKLFVIYDNFSVYEITNYVAIGSGELFCLPYLKNIPKNNIEKHLFEMLLQTSLNLCSISPPFVFINTQKPKEIKIVNNDNFEI